MLFLSELLQSHLKFIMGFLPLTILILLPAYKNFLKNVIYLYFKSNISQEELHLLNYLFSI